MQRLLIITVAWSVLAVCAYFGVMLWMDSVSQAEMSRGATLEDDRKTLMATPGLDVETLLRKRPAITGNELTQDDPRYFMRHEFEFDGLRWHSPKTTHGGPKFNASYRNDENNKLCIVSEGHIGHITPPTATCLIVQVVDPSGAKWERAGRQMVIRYERGKVVDEKWGNQFQR